ncbi:MAG: hypothetical protein ACYDHY_13040 [Acidiferrobacterales bacterium]
MVGSNRDEFSKKTKMALALRANYSCSFPGCKRRTSGPSDESPSGVINIGIAAHIHAAAPGGRRYLSGMTSTQRLHITNGIWLCANHSAEIDRDEARYTGDVLREMKADHERQVAAELSGPMQVRPGTDLLSIGPEFVCTGELIGTSGLEWRLRIAHFIKGDLSALIDYAERFSCIDPYDRFVLVNDLGDGRQLAAAPVWRKTDAGYELSCAVSANFPRTNAHQLGADFALSENHDLMLNSKGDIAVVSGLAALPQKIQGCLSIRRGEILSNPNAGSRIASYFDELKDSPWFQRFVKLEVIRLACVPYRDRILSKEYTPLRCVRRVLAVEQLLSEQNGSWLPFHFDLDVEGIGSWQHDLSLFVPQKAFPDSSNERAAQSGETETP